MTVGRNDPCPCGSGKKYKKCCQPQQEVISLAAVRVDNLHRDLWSKLSDFMGGQAVGEDAGAGFARFFVIPMEEEDEEQTAELAMDWVAFAYRTDNGDTLCERFAKSGKGLSDQECQVLQSWARSSPGIFRVEVAEGAEYRLRRLPDDRVFLVRAPGMKLGEGDHLYAWLLPLLSTYRFGYVVQDLAAETLEPLMHMVQIEMALLQRQRPLATWDDLYREHWPRIIDALSVAVVGGDGALQIISPPGSSVRWDGPEPPYESSKAREVGRLIEQTLAEMDPPLEPDDIAGAIRLWKDGLLALQPRILRPEGWAAGVVYAYMADVLGEETTQADVAGMLGISVSTVGSRSRELAGALDIRWLDPRYVGLMSPFVRLHYRDYWMRATGFAAKMLELEPEERGPLERAMRFLEQDRRPEPTAGPVWQAEELLDQAWEASGTRRVRLAEKALALWPDAADAYVMLAEEAAGRGRLQEALKHFQAGVQAGQRALGPRFFTENVGHFYGLVESRPYMRARAGMAGCLWELDRREEALAHYTELLRLNPGDNQGIRYVLAACYLEMGDDNRLGSLLAAHDDDPMASIVFTRALWQYRRSGPGGEADALLQDALSENRHVPDYLLGKKPLPPEPPQYIDFGGELEAAGYAWSFGQGWRQTPGALDWLRSRLH